MRHAKGASFSSFVVSLLAGLILFTDVSYGAEKVSPGATLPRFTLSAPDDPEIQQYLGLKSLKSFTLSQIPAKFMLIEFFSLYCPICHKQAPSANKIYKVIRQDPALNKDIKMIGIGTGNNEREVEAFKTNLRVPFPLFPDLDFKIHKKIGEPRTPFTILTTNKGKVLLIHSGVVEDTDEFIGKIKKIHEQN
jgi:peroxiredoxin